MPPVFCCEMGSGWSAEAKFPPVDTSAFDSIAYGLGEHRPGVDGSILRRLLAGKRGAGALPSNRSPCLRGEEKQLGFCWRARRL